jgi:hypothetical protein
VLLEPKILGPLNTDFADGLFQEICRIRLFPETAAVARCDIVSKHIAGGGQAGQPND